MEFVAGKIMPEAPEVEAVARTLRPYVQGRKIRLVHVLHAIAVRPQGAARFKNRVEGTRIQGIDRCGKYLLLRLDKGCLVLHFKFDGQLLWFDCAGEALARKLHVDVVLETRQGALGYVDRRHLGRVLWFAQAKDSAGIRRLGVDVYSREFTPDRLARVCRNSRQPLKILLMDQRKIAGLGNIYTSESLWRARLDPRGRSDQLTSSQSRRLHKAVVSVLYRALECCLHPAPVFRDPQWWFAGLGSMLRVYGRGGMPCARCRTKIRKIEQGGRSTYLCPRCQRPGFR
jgi:formamidopyrimidine-DNA glycosylase